MGTNKLFLTLDTKEGKFTQKCKYENKVLSLKVIPISKVNKYEEARY